MVNQTSITRFFNQFTRTQWLTLIVFSIADFCQAVCVSLQAPFYPAEAERKGASATAYGLVFGCFELTVFLASPLIGKRLNKWGAKRVFNVGILTTGACSILFGLLDRIENVTGFIGLSLVIRAVEALGNSAFLCASFSIIAKEFPDNVATMFASLETFFGLGLIAGPSVGGALYQLGGYILPFSVLGGCLVLAACFTFFVLPQNYDEDTKGQVSERGVLQVLKIPSIGLAAFSILCASNSIGFLLTTLEPHLRQFDLSPLMMGVMFVINGGSYAFSAPIFGVLVDKCISPNVVNLVGTVAIIVSFLFLGPAPFIPMPTIFSICIAALVLHGIGIGAMLVSSFATAHREAVKNGFPDNLETYGLISGLWTSTFALGAFLGPVIAGVLLDQSGMRFATLYISVFGMGVLAVNLMYHLLKKCGRCGRSDISDYEALDESTIIHDHVVTSYGAIGGSNRSDSIGYQSGSSASASGRSSSVSPNSGDPDTVSPLATSSRTLPTAVVDVHVGANSSHYLSPHQRSHPLSPKSPLQCGSTGLLGGVMGYSSGVFIQNDNDHLGDGTLEVGHVMAPHDFPVACPPQRNTTSRRQARRKRSSRRETETEGPSNGSNTNENRDFSTNATMNSGSS